ncbi:MAG: glycosyltransferase family 4 protein [Limisphaerales bacterium]
MRVTHVITRLIVGGAQENTISTVLGLHRKPGVQVDLISGPTNGPEGSLEPEFAKLPGLLRIVPSLVRPVDPLNDCAALKELTQIFRDTQPEIVHTHSGKAGVLGRLAAKRAGVPIIIHTIHGPSFGPFQGALANFIFRSAEKKAVSATTHFVTVANAMTEHYLAAGIGRPDQYTRIFSGFDIDPFISAVNDTSLRERLGLKPDDFVVGKIARLFELKGHDDLFAIAPELVRRCSRMKFLLVGDGPWRQKFEHQARALGLQNHFVFTGLVPPNEVPRYVGVMDALVHLSRREGLPRALPQALGAGKPVVAYDCDGAREVCMEDETGFLVNAGDLDTLKNRLLRLAEDPQLCFRLGSKGREMVKRCFPVQQMVDEIYDLYLKLSKERSKP